MALARWPLSASQFQVFLWLCPIPRLLIDLGGCYRFIPQVRLGTSCESQVTFTSLVDIKARFQLRLRLARSELLKLSGLVHELRNCLMHVVGTGVRL